MLSGSDLLTSHLNKSFKEGLVDGRRVADSPERLPDLVLRILFADMIHHVDPLFHFMLTGWVLLLVQLVAEINCLLKIDTGALTEAVVANVKLN